MFNRCVPGSAPGGDGGGFGCHRAAAAPPLPRGVMSAVRDDPAVQPYPPHPLPAVRPAAEPRLRAGAVRVSLQAGLLRAQRRARCVPCPGPPTPPSRPRRDPQRRFGTPIPPFHPQCRLKVPLAWRAAGAGRAARAAGTTRPARLRRTALCVRPCCAARRAACWPCSSACCSPTTAGGARREQRGVPTIPPPRCTPPPTTTPGGRSPSTPRALLMSLCPCRGSGRRALCSWRPSSSGRCCSTSL